MKKLVVVILVILLVGVSIAGCTSTSTPKKNKPPVAIFSVSKTNPTHNEVITFDASTSYDKDKNDNTTLEFEWDFKDGSTKIQKGPGNKVITHYFEDDGTYQVTLYVYDKKTMSTAVKDIFVSNMAPKIVSSYPLENATVFETATLEFIVNATDQPNEDTLTYQWAIDNSDVTGETSKMYSYIPGLEDSGDHKVSVKVNDGNNGIVYKFWNVTVLNKNQAPIIVSYSPLVEGVTLAESASQAFSVVASDPDDDTLTYRWFKDSTAITGETKNSFIYSPDYNASGTYVIKVVISDGNASIERPWNVTVTNSNRAPNIVSVQPGYINVQMNETDSKTFQITAIDPDEDTLTYDWTIDTVPITGVTIQSYVYTPTLADAGDHTIIAQVTDGKGGLDSAQWKITVNNVNQAPGIGSFLPATNPTVFEMSTTNFSVVASDPDGDSLTYQWYLNGTVLTGKTSATYAFIPDYDMGGTSQKSHTIKVIVKDTSNAEANHTWTAVVTNLNRGPVAKAAVNMTKPGVGLEVKFDATGSSDPDGDTLTYTWNFGDQTQPLGGKIVTHTYIKPGLFTATVTVSDGTLSAQAQVSVDVNITQSWMSVSMGLVSPMVINDVDGDGTLEMIFGGLESDTAGTYTGFLYIVDASNFNQEFKSGNIGMVNDIKIGNVDGDANKEIVVATVTSETNVGSGGVFSGKVVVFDGTGLHPQDWISGDIGNVMTLGIGDLDGDAINEIIAPHSDSFFPSASGVNYYGNITVFGWDGNSITQEWISTNFGGYGRAIEIGDIDGDTAVEAVIGTVDSLNIATMTFVGRVTVLGRSGSNWVFQNTWGGVGMVLDIVIADPDKDMNMEAVVGDLNSISATHNVGNVHVLSDTMTEEWSSSDFGAVTCVAVDDPDKDNINEIIFGVDYNETDDPVNLNVKLPEGFLYILNGQSHAQKFKSGNIGAVTSLAIGNIDKSANVEISVGTWTRTDASDNHEGYVYVFVYNTDQTAFQQLWRSPKIGKISSNGLAMADTDSDGFMEIFFGTTDSSGTPYTGKVYVYTNKNKA